MTFVVVGMVVQRDFTLLNMIVGNISYFGFCECTVAVKCKLTVFQC